MKYATPMTVVVLFVCFRGRGFTFARYLNTFLYASLMELTALEDLVDKETSWFWFLSFFFFLTTLSWRNKHENSYNEKSQLT